MLQGECDEYVVFCNGHFRFGKSSLPFSVMFYSGSFRIIDVESIN